MKKFEITEGLLVGHEEIDAEHVYLAGLVNAGMDALEGGNGDKLPGILTEFEGGLKKHFLNEEKVMDELGYRKLDEHKEQHKRTLHEIEVMKNNLHNIELKHELILYTLIDALISDVVIPDFDLKSYLREIDYRG